MTQKAPFLNVVGLTKSFGAERSPLRKTRPGKMAVNGVSLEIYSGESLALVGESGSGKSTLGRSILRLIPADGGSVIHDGLDLLRMTEKEFRPYRPRFQMVFQNPAQALDPRQSAGSCVAEPLRVHASCSKALLKDRVRELLVRVGLDPDVSSRFPHQLSGGQQQRLAVARALATGPEFLVTDEPTSSLDASLKRKIVELLMNLRKNLGLTILLISHDLGVVANASDRVAVMYRGAVFETAPTRTLIDSPAHPYTRLLLDSALYRIESRSFAGGDFGRTSGWASEDEQAGCAFAGRCAYAQPICRKEVPASRSVGRMHTVACHLAEASAGPSKAGAMELAAAASMKG